MNEYFDATVLLLAKHNFGAFFVPQKTGLCGGGSNRCAVLNNCHSFMSCYFE
jgi:hypothetical protein